MRKPLLFIVAILVALAVLPDAPHVQGADDAIAPQVVDTAPVNGEELQSNGGVTFYFDQPMDLASVQSALKISPAATGNLIWSNDTAATFTLTSPLQRDTQYTFSIGAKAKSKAGLPLRDTFELRVRTASDLQLLQGFPANGTKDVESEPNITVNRRNEQYFDSNSRYENVPRDAKISITFSQPMDTTATEAAFTLAAGASKADGDFAWNDKKTSFTFTPKTLLGYATQYTARINGGAARSANGSPLDKDASVSFTTLALPDIINTYPHQGDVVTAYGGFWVTFSPPIKDVHM